MPEYTVLSLDGSLQNFGMSVATCKVDAKGVIISKVHNLTLSKTTKDKKAKRSDDDMQRFAQHYRIILNILDSFDIDYITAEIPSGSRDVRAAFAFGGVTAIIGALSVEHKVITVTPTEAKLAATGYKFADKEDVIEEMYKQFPNAQWITSSRQNAMGIKTSEGKYLTNANEHIADALAINLAGMKKVTVKTAK